VANLLTLVELFEGREARADYEAQYLGSGIKYSELKQKLSEAIYRELEPIQERRRELERKPEFIKEILEEGRIYCSKIAKKTLLEVKEKMGLA